ncbi:MAG: aminotransferase class V-fold PLP-dependent enzyme [Patescibacteria group bacterium]|nr:aminotransferase class V-fold PLP-dependent enzyme [Patescibacteria group bacterium]MDE1965637.1 aminotransferase class V-fold PLP-dependent enzyme [Patescibacteria group bacterium]
MPYGRRTYLDFAAAAPTRAAARGAYERASRRFGNPSSPHAEGRAAKAILEDARTALARELSVKPDALVFTSGATESNNIALIGHVEALAAAGRAYESIHLLYAPSAHASVVHTVAALARRGVMAEPLPLAAGAVDLAALARMVRPETALVAMDAVCGETGIIWNTREVRHALDAARPSGPRILLLADAAQAPLVEDVTRTRIGADLLSLDAQKIGGVRGIGVLVADRTTALSPVMFGGGQERELRSGTPSPALAAAFSAALREAGEERDAFRARASLMRARLISFVTERYPGALVNGGKRQAPHILNLSFPGKDTDYLVALLDEAGFAVSTRSACETDAEGSRAVFALYGDPERAKSTLRVSWGSAVSERALRAFGRTLLGSLAFIDNAAS